MPAFNQYGNLTTSIGIGDSIALFANETLTAPVFSFVVTVQQSGPIVRGVRQFQINFASSPTAVVKLFGSNTAPTSSGPDAAGTVIYTSTNTQNDYYEDGNAFIYYWAELVSQSAGGKLTVIMNQV